MESLLQSVEGYVVVGDGFVRTIGFVVVAWLNNFVFIN